MQVRVGVWRAFLVALVFAVVGNAGRHPGSGQGSRTTLAEEQLLAQVGPDATTPGGLPQPSRRLAAKASTLRRPPPLRRRPPPKRSPAPAPGRLVLPRLPRLVVRAPALPRWVQPPAVGCPGKYEVEGADGGADSARALAAASAAAPVLYLGVGTYRVLSSVTLRKPIVAGCGARLEVAAGATLTVAAAPRVWCSTQGGLFTGPGKVVFTSAVPEVHPAWFATSPAGLVGEALQRAADACGAPCTLLLTRAIGISATVGLNPANAVLSTMAATLYPAGFTGRYEVDALALRPGQYNPARPIHLANIINMRTCVTIPGGVRGATVFLGGMRANQDGIVLKPGGGTIASTSVAHASACALVENCVVIDGGRGPAGALTDVSVRVNFVTTGSGAALLLRGTPPRLARSGVVFMAVDPTAQSPAFVLLRNAAAAPVTGLIFGAEAWVGGFAAAGALPPGQLVTGRFDGLAATISAAPIAVRNAFAISGSGNVLLLTSSVGSAGTDFPLAEAPNRLSSFRDGTSPPDNVMYVGFTVKKDWPPGQRRTYYLYSPYAQATAPGRMTCIPFRAGNPGFVCASVAGQHSQSRYQVAVTLVNGSRETVRAGFHHRFGVQVGP